MAGIVDHPRSSARPEPGELVKASARVGVRAIFTRFWPDTKPFRGRFSVGLLLVGAGPALSTAELWLFKILIDRVVVPHDLHLFPALAGSYVGLAVIQGGVSFSDQYLSTWIGERFVLNLRSRLFGHLHQLSSGFFERNWSGRQAVVSGLRVARVGPL